MHAGAAQHRSVVMRMGVDEPWGQRQAVGVDIAVGFVVSQVADSDDAVADDRYIRFEPQGPKAIEYRCIPDDQIAAHCHELVPSVSFVE